MKQDIYIFDSEDNLSEIKTVDSLENKENSQILFGEIAKLKIEISLKQQLINKLENRLNAIEKLLKTPI